MNVGLPFLSNAYLSFMVHMRWQLLCEVLLILPHTGGYFAFYTPGILGVLIQQYHSTLIPLGHLSQVYLPFLVCVLFKSKTCPNFFCILKAKAVLAQKVPRMCVK